MIPHTLPRNPIPFSSHKTLLVHLRNLHTVAAPKLRAPLHCHHHRSLHCRSMNWFVSTFGEAEHIGYSAIQKVFRLVPDPKASIPGAQCVIAPNGRSFPVGVFEAPLLSEVRSYARPDPLDTGNPPETKLVHSHISIGSALDLHAQNPNACFQVASQFNALEFVSPNVTPEEGITSYILDNTQGPACSMAAAAGTLYRNYFLPLDGDHVGQTKTRQLNTLQPFLEKLQPDSDGIFVRSGYTDASSLEALERVGHAIKSLSPSSYEELLGSLRVSTHRQVGVTHVSQGKLVPEGERILVTQVFCSAISVDYSGFTAASWEVLARAVLDAAYEGTLLQAARDLNEGVGNGVVFLTFLGGGVFGNLSEWIAGAIARAIWKCRDLALDVRICHYKGIKKDIVRLVDAALEESKFLKN